MLRGSIALVLLSSCAAAPAHAPSPGASPRANATRPAQGSTEHALAEGAAAESTEVEAPPPPPRSPFAYANIDPDDDLVVGPPDERPTCYEDLAAAGVSFQKASLPVHVPKKSKIACGAPQVVTYKGSPAKIAWSPSVLVTCTMALALARFETLAQEEAIRAFGKRIVRVHHLGTYACREMAAYPGWVSEHSYANAIDVADFVLEDGRKIEVLKHFAPKEQLPTKAEPLFLRALARRAFVEETFSSVLTPFFDALHANHFHLDMARFRSDGTQSFEASP